MNIVISLARRKANNWVRISIHFTYLMYVLPLIDLSAVWGQKSTISTKRTKVQTKCVQKESTGGQELQGRSRQRGLSNTRTSNYEKEIKQKNMTPFKIPRKKKIRHFHKCSQKLHSVILIISLSTYKKKNMHKID